MNVTESIGADKYRNCVPLVRGSLTRARAAAADSRLRDEVRREAAELASRIVEAREKHDAEERRLTELFRADLEVEHGFTGHPKAGALFSKAWDHGHAVGLHEVAFWYADLAELAR